MEPVAIQKENFYQLFSQLPQFQIEAKGSFKYVQIECQGVRSGQTKLIIRGKDRPIRHHKQIFEAFRNEAIKKGLSVVDSRRDEWGILRQFKLNHGEDQFILKCTGGGRMTHSHDTKSLQIFGFSTKYSPNQQTNHHLTVSLAHKFLPTYKKIFVGTKFY